MPEPDILEQLNEQARKLNEVRKKLAFHEDMVKILKKDEAELVEKTIPTLMDLKGMKSFETDEGFGVNIEEQVFARIPVAKRGEAFKWLRDNNESGMIKEELVTSVHPQTLKAWVKGKLKEGAELPADLFGIYTRKVAKVK